MKTIALIMDVGKNKLVCNEDMIVNYNYQNNTRFRVFSCVNYFIVTPQANMHVTDTMFKNQMKSNKNENCRPRSLMNLAQKF